MVGDEYKPELEAAVGTSTKKDAREAGREVAKNTLSKMKSKPDFFLLFPTAHYESQGGFKEFLSGVWEILPEGTPLIGGTMAGFLNHQGVYARGATALAVSYPNMDVTIGYGKNTKRNHKKAAKNCAMMLKNGLKNNHENKIIFSFISASEIISIPGLKDITNIKSKLLAKTMLPMFSFVQKVFQKGLGNEQEVLEHLTKMLPEFNILHGSAMNSVSLETNYQFFNKKVLTKAALCLAIETDMNFRLEYANAAEKMNIEFKITDMSKNRRIIKKINNKPAFKELQRIMDWQSGELHEDRWLKTFMEFPFMFYKNNKISIRCVGMIVGSYLGFFSKIENEEASMAHMSQSRMVEAVEEVLTCNKPEFGFLTSCINRQAFLGIKVYDVQEKLKRYFKEKPFLLVYAGGEGIRKHGEELEYLNESITSAIFGGE